MRKTKPKYFSILTEPKRLYPFFLFFFSFFYFFASQHIEKITSSDPDRYFHLAIAKQTAEHGLVRQIPQAEDLEWDKAYPNSFFLFSVLSGAFYKLGGEKGALLLTPVLAALVLSLLFFQAGPFVGPVAAGLIALFALTIPDFLNRICIFRPHLFALVWFLLLVGALRKKSPFPALLWSFFYVLSYHAFYVPISVCLLFLFADRKGWGESARAPLAGILGTGLGIILNPYFPLSFFQGIQSALVGTNAAGLSVDHRPTENLALPVSTLLLRYMPFFFLLSWTLLAPYLKNKEQKPKSNKSRQISFSQDGMLLTCLFFWALCFSSARAIEYAIPVTLLFFAQQYPKFRKQQAFLVGVLGTSLVSFFGMAPGFLLKVPEPQLNVSALFDAIRLIPNDGSVKKIYNCSWFTSPFLLYLRPDLHFTDIMDPSFLHDSAPEKFALRDMMEKGAVTYPYGLVKFAFHSQRVLCDRPDVIYQLEHDPNFQRVYPAFPPEKAAENHITHYLYAPLTASLSHFVRSYRVSDASLHAADPATKPNWIYAQNHNDQPSEEHSPYFFPRKWFKENTQRRELASLSCALVEPLLEGKNVSGSEVLGVGGDGLLEIWLNKKLLWSSSLSSMPPRALSLMIPLAAPFTETSSLAVQICAQHGREPAIALSFWKRKQIEDTCRQKMGPKPVIVEAGKNGQEIRSCFSDPERVATADTTTTVGTGEQASP